MTTTIAVTISCPPRKDQPQYKNSYLAYYLDDGLKIRLTFNQSRVKSYIFYPELDPKGRLHYHGSVRVDKNERVRFYKHTRAKLARLGYIDTREMATFIDILKWSIYCKKDWGSTIDILNNNSPIMPKRMSELKIYNTISLLDLTHYFPVPHEECEDK